MHMYDGGDDGNLFAQRQFGGTLKLDTIISFSYDTNIKLFLAIEDMEKSEEDIQILTRDRIIGLLEILLSPGDSYCELFYSEFPHLSLYGPPVKGFNSYASFP